MSRIEQFSRLTIFLAHSALRLWLFHQICTNRAILSQIGEAQNKHFGVKSPEIAAHLFHI